MAARSARKMTESTGKKCGETTGPVVYEGNGRRAEVKDMGDNSYEVTVENGGVTTIYDKEEAHALARWWVA
jgi:hypothetical protein